MYTNDYASSCIIDYRYSFLVVNAAAWMTCTLLYSINWPLLIGNISSGNRHIHANYRNFNLSHTILIQGRAHGRWKGWFAKFMGGVSHDLQRWFCKSLLPPPLSVPLDQYRVTQIEVSIVCMEMLVFTRYVALLIRAIYTTRACQNCYTYSKIIYGNLKR
jgi:hypothetical protein